MIQKNETKAFQRELDLQLLKSEKQRLLFLGILFTAGVFAFIFQVYLAREKIESVETAFLILPVIAFFAGAIFEFSLFYYTDSQLKKDRVVPGFVYTVSLLVDLIFPTVIIISLMNLTGPFIGLSSPGSYIFFIFILLAILRLNFWPAAVVGLCCAIIYSILIQYGFYMDSSVFPDIVWQNPFYIYGRSMIMFLTGILIGIIALQIRRRTEAAIEQFHEKEKILDTFGQHVSPEVVNQLMNQSYEIESRDVTILFLDIRNFTAYSESRSPIEVIGRLNEMFAFMIDIINRNHGIINKFLGDGFMAVFGAPIQKGNNEQNALNAATQIIEELDRRKNTYSEDAFEVGIGIHSGEAVTGTVGSPARKEYTIIGDVVNLTARLEALNKKFNTRVLITDRVYKAAGMPGLQAEKMPDVQVKGRKELLQTYRLF